MVMPFSSMLMEVLEERVFLKIMNFSMLKLEKKQIKIHLKVHFLFVCLTNFIIAMVLMSGMMVINTMVNIRIIKSMVRVSILMPMVTNMLGNIRMVNWMVRAFTII